MTVLQKNTVPVQKITIVPRTNGALGYVWQVPDEEKSLETQAELEADIVIACAGRAAEALKFPSVTTGAASDIQQATEKARKMVTMYGMSEKFGMVQLEGITGEYLDRRAVQQCSDETGTKIDNEVRGIIKRAYARAFKALKKNEAILDAIAAFLYEHETITGKEFVEIYEKVSGRKVEIGKRLLSDSLLKSDKDKERDKEKVKGQEAASRAREKDKEKKRQEGYYGAFHSPYTSGPTEADLEEVEEKEREEEDYDTDSSSEVTQPEVENTSEPEDDTPKPWETFAREQEKIQEVIPEVTEDFEETEASDESEEKDGFTEFAGASEASEADDTNDSSEEDEASDEEDADSLPDRSEEDDVE